ncbi:MAG: 3-hydroxyacyl-CoA dehydrogenase NAD-binding domain-containing protein [Rhodoferax sp.]|nr:3-hydroxyacyl-CoA dehydrogenase NAD-binding domain-containing protein [Rhodoferax sp.]MDP3652380.1 3-hydroxyacyl-CoA dehydrogenase NAD-binding domain-containing protein [Rhodoferax sp.]
MAGAVSSIRTRIAKRVEKGKWSQERAAQASCRLVAVQHLLALADTRLVVEAIVENRQAKQALYSELL